MIFENFRLLGGGKLTGGLSERLKGDDVYIATLKNRATKWPSRGKNNRIEPVCEPVITPKHKIRSTDQVFTIGSCFARNIELALREAGFDVPSANVKFPQEELWQGTRLHSGLLNKYTPQSILNELEYVFNDKYEATDFLVEGEKDKYYDLQLHTNQAVTLERGIKRRKEIKSLIKDFVSNADVIIITLGLIEVWWDDKNKLYLNETPPKKLVNKYPGRFFFEAMSPATVFESVSTIVELFKKHSKRNAWVMMTVSPIPLGRTFRDQDVIVANMYSKSVLRVAAEIESEKSEFVEYFPSYESVMLSERSQFWLDDQIHLEYSAVQKITKRVIREYGEGDS